jgi:eukaryotic-like serine/threonine-protein kinase
MTSGALVGGKYRLVRRIGLGAMGEVWEAVNVDTDREVALKLITRSDPELRRRLVREARAIGRLNHPNIVQILDRGETQAGEPFLVMQLLQGETLGQRLRRERSLSQPVAAGIALDIARALRVAHEKQIIHRDLKPGNIILHREPDTEEDVVKVVDFGVSKLTVDGEASTMSDGIVGSPAYMSPEQIRSSAVDGRADVWALGVILFEMLAGERPFPGTQPVTVLGQILQQVVPRIESVTTDVSPGFGDVIAGCLERDLDRRIASAAELIRLLRPFGPRNRFATIDDSALPGGRRTSLPGVPAAFAVPPPPATPPTVATPPPAPPQEPASPAAGDERDSGDAATGIFQPRMLLPLPAAARRGATGTLLIASPRPAAPAPPSRESSTALYVREPSEERTTEKIPEPAPPAPPPPAPPPPAPPAERRRGYGATLPMVPEPNRLVGSGTMPIDPRLIPPSPAAPVSVWVPSPDAVHLRGTLPLEAPVMPLPEPEPLPAPPGPAPPAPAPLPPWELPVLPTSRWPTVLLLFAVVAFVTAVTLLVATLWGSDPGAAPAGSASAPPGKTP